ncbi:MAG: 5-formyltetrahydrofolate cyclo-ligase [Cytophagales bacterium]
MLKKEIRKVFLEKRIKLSQDEIQDLSKRISNIFISEIDLSSIRNIHVYLPLSKKNEVNTFVLIEEIEKINPHIKLLVPIVINDEIHSFEFEKNAEIVFGQFDIPEPKQRIKVEKIPDLVIVPLLGIDEKGYRVGYGGGFYDKYLSTLPSNVLKVGLSFWDCIDRIDDIDEFDIPLDLVITPSKIVEFGYY